MTYARRQVTLCRVTPGYAHSTGTAGPTAVCPKSFVGRKNGDRARQQGRLAGCMQVMFSVDEGSEAAVKRHRSSSAGLGACYHLDVSPQTVVHLLRNNEARVHTARPLLCRNSTQAALSHL